MDMLVSNEVVAQAGLPTDASAWFRVKRVDPLEPQIVGALRRHLGLFDSANFYFAPRAELSEEQKLYILYVFGCKNGLEAELANDMLPVQLERRGLMLPLETAWECFLRRWSDPLQQYDLFHYEVSLLDWLGTCYFVCETRKHPLVSAVAGRLSRSHRDALHGEWGIAQKNDVKPWVRWNEKYIWIVKPPEVEIQKAVLLPVDARNN